MWSFHIHVFKDGGEVDCGDLMTGNLSDYVSQNRVHLKAKHV